MDVSVDQYRWCAFVTSTRTPISTRTLIHPATDHSRPLPYYLHAHLSHTLTSSPAHNTLRGCCVVTHLHNMPATTQTKTITSSLTNRSATRDYRPTAGYSFSSSTSPATPAPVPSAPASTRLRLCIDSTWYDLTHWQKQHPGGAEILAHLNGQDATDAFYSLHSTDAIDRLARMANTSLATPVKPGEVADVDPVTQSFRALRLRLIREGWFKRSVMWELFYQLSVYAFAIAGTISAWTGYSNLLALLCITLAMQQAGWIGHDYVHGRGPYQSLMGRSMSGLINAFSPTWWSHKHNTHHVFTNHIGIDADIENDPVIHLFFPSTENDVWFRRFQHLYFVPVASFLFISWRIQSLQHTIKQNNIWEMAIMCVNYIWLFTLPLYVSLGAVYLAGGLVAIVVTATHQSEEMLPPVHLSPSAYNFVQCQFATTRDARTNGNFVMEWFWGGMQYQLEHHLFPTMPKYRYGKLCAVVEEWANSVGVEYKAESVWQLWWRNFETLRLFAGPEVQAA